MTEQTEEEYLAAYDPSGFPPVAVTADFVLFGETEEDVHVLLIKRGNHPYKGMWALPGGFMDPGETLEETAVRELREETLIGPGYFDKEIGVVEVGSFSAPERDPRTRVVSVAFAAIAGGQGLPLARPADDATRAAWVPLNRLDRQRLAFDHGTIIAAAKELLL